METSRSYGRELAAYLTHNDRPQSLSRIERSGIMESDQLVRWLRSLQPPTGIFVCNDIRGQQVLNACQLASISVPDELAVIGVDNDDAICSLCAPPLSSVYPNAEQVGYPHYESDSSNRDLLPPRTHVR